MTYRDNLKGWYYYDNFSRPTVTYSGDSAEKANLRYYDGLGRPSWTYDWTGSAWRPTTYETYDLANRRVRLAMGRRQLSPSTSETMSASRPRGVRERFDGGRGLWLRRSGATRRHLSRQRGPDLLQL